MNSWKWDVWQEEVLGYSGNVTLRCGRQVGKSVVIAEKAVRFARGHGGTVTMVLAASQRQSSLLFEKVKGLLDLLELGGVKCYAEVPTLTRIVLLNGSRIYSLPAGKTGYFIRGFSIDLLIVDEAAYVLETVWNSILPMIAVSREVRGFGWIILLSTPFGKGGFYFNSFSDPDFRSWHVSSEDCSRISKSFLLKEKRRMSKAEYRQEYLGEFTDDWNQFFKTELIKRQMTFIEWGLGERVEGSRFYLGVDVARYGGDENAFVVVELWGWGVGLRLKVVKCFTTTRISTVDTIGRIVELDRLYDFGRVFIDDAGVGGAVTDVLEEKLGRKVVGLNNASKRVEIQGEEKKKGILKEDLYSNALVLLENEKLELIADMGLLRSLKSITFQYGTEKQGRLQIYGDYSHLTEAMVRACWCTREKALDVYLY